MKIETQDTKTTTMTDDERAGPSTPSFEDKDFDQNLLQIYTPPHTTHPTPTDTSPYAIEDTQIDTEPPSNTEPPSHTPHVQDSKRANKKN